MTMPAELQLGSMGWEVLFTEVAEANIYFKVINPIVIASLDIDISFMILSTPVAEDLLVVQYHGVISRQAVPSPPSPPVIGVPGSASPDFGTITLVNPADATVSYVESGVTPLIADEFFAATLKAWQPTSGADAQAFRHLHLTPNIAVNAGDYLGFYMDSPYGFDSSKTIDSEMQFTFNYWYQS